MANRYDIVKGTIPDEPPPPPQKKNKHDRLAGEIAFMIEAHDKMVRMHGGEAEFRKRVNRLYLEGQVSEKAFNKLAGMYGWNIVEEDDDDYNNVLQEYMNSSGGCHLQDSGSCGGSRNGGRC